MISGNDYPWVKDNPQDLGDVASWDVVYIKCYRCEKTHSITLKHWNGNIVILRKFSSLAAPEVVSLTTSGAAGDENFLKNAFSCQWRSQRFADVPVLLEYSLICGMAVIYHICYIMWSFMVVISLNWAGPLCKGLQITSRHDTNLFVIGGTGGCRQWRQSWHHDNSRFSMVVVTQRINNW